MISTEGRLERMSGSCTLQIIPLQKSKLTFCCSVCETQLGGHRWEDEGLLRVGERMSDVG